jgi:hypothetical protein
MTVVQNFSSALLVSCKNGDYSRTVPFGPIEKHSLFRSVHLIGNSFIVSFPKRIYIFYFRL